MSKKTAVSKKPTMLKVAKDVKASKAQMSSDVGKLLWLEGVATHDYPSAANYLSLIADEHTVDRIVAALKEAKIEMHRANDVLRAGKLALLPLDDPSVKRDLSKVMLGGKWSPVLVIRGDILNDAPLTIADGYHRVCASFHLSENTYIPCKIVDLPVPEKA